jgi:hypothetical protein
MLVPEQLELGLHLVGDRIAEVEADDFGSDVVEESRFERHGATL